MKHTKTYQKSRRQGATIRHKTHRQLKQALVPHKGNQYRPHLVRPFGLIAVIIVALGIPAMANQLSTGSVLGAHDGVTPQALYSETNTVRTQHGLDPLTSNAKLTQAATLKAHDMITHQYWAHTSPSGVTPWHWFTKAGYNFSAAGENLAKNFATSNGTMSAWMASPEHRANILDARYTNIGIAVAHGTMDGAPIELVVALYGEPVSALASTTASTSSATPSVLAAHDVQLTSWQHLMIGLRALTPAAMMGVLLLAVAALVASFAHVYRNKLPKAWRVSWRHHHGLYKTLGLVSLIVVVVSTYGGGQI